MNSSLVSLQFQSSLRFFCVIASAPALARFACLPLMVAVAGCAHTMVALDAAGRPTLWQRFDQPNLVADAVGLSGVFAAADLPKRTERRVGQLQIHADFPLAGQHRLIRELDNLRVTISQQLDLPVSDEPIHLYLFADLKDYQRFVQRHFPQFPTRRACFVETDTTLAVFAAWQERIAEDLRHETTHGYLHAVVPGLPLWLDEGLAEFFELPEAAAGLHDRHAAQLAGRLLEGTWQPQLERLESLEDAAAMSQDHYAEAWCWVHWLLQTTPERRRLLERYLSDLRHDPATAPLSVRLREAEGPPTVTTAAVRSHVEQIGE
jgi:hypothetical protein